MTATITAYGIGKFVHVAAVILAFGATYAYPFMFAVAEKAGLQYSLVAMRTSQAIEKYLITPGAVVVMLAGFYLVSKGNFDLSTSWIDVGIVAWVILIGMSQGFFKPQGNTAVQLAERDLAAGGEPSPELLAVTKRLAVGGQVAGLLVLLALFFMVVKP
jgi:uncharacterized membrane protein